MAAQQLALQFALPTSCVHDRGLVPFYWWDGKQNRVSTQCSKCGQWQGGQPPTGQGYNDVADYYESTRGKA